MRKVLACLFALVLGLGTAFAKLNDFIGSLDEAIGDAPISTFAPGVSKLLEVEENTLEKALSQTKLKLSDVALAKFISEKSGQPFDELLAAPAPDWNTVLTKKKISQKEAEEYLDSLQTEVAFLMLDYREQKKK